MKDRECVRVVSTVVLVATGVNVDGHREVLVCRLQRVGQGRRGTWSSQDLFARGLTGTRLIISEAHAGLVEAMLHSAYGQLDKGA